MKPNDSHARNSRSSSTGETRSVKPLSTAITASVSATDTRYIGTIRRTREMKNPPLSNGPSRSTRPQNRKPVIMKNSETAISPVSVKNCSPAWRKSALPVTCSAYIAATWVKNTPSASQPRRPSTICARPVSVSSRSWR